MIPQIQAGLSRYRSLAPLMFALCCLLSSARMAKDAPIPGRVNADAVVQRSDVRFAELKKLLPDRGVVGYIGQPGVPGLADYYLAAYALAPVVLDDSPNHPYVVGNFPATPPSSIPQNLHLVHDFGNGVLLFARTSDN